MSNNNEHAKFAVEKVVDEAVRARNLQLSKRGGSSAASPPFPSQFLSLSLSTTKKYTHTQTVFNLLLFSFY